MMAKKRTAEQEALRAAWKKPDRKWFLSRLHAFGPGFWTNYNEVSLSFGKPPFKFHGDEVPESGWVIWFRMWPFRFMVWRHLKLVLSM